uniref:Uncharacterized protein n=1 Tax=Tetranychus urticae TaxID=32264 RepID=T1KNI0_TETUR
MIATNHPIQRKTLFLLKLLPVCLLFWRKKVYLLFVICSTHPVLTDVFREIRFPRSSLHAPSASPCDL